MVKKVITTVLLLCLLSGISVMMVTATDTTRQGRERSGMPPRGEMPSGDFAPPEGFTPPEGEFMPPKDFAPPEGEFMPPEEFSPAEGDVMPPQDSGELMPPQSDENNNAETAAPETDTGVAEENQKSTENNEKSEQTQNRNSPFGGRMPDGMGGFSGNMQNSQNTAAEQPTGFFGFVKTYSTPITSVVLLGLAFIFVIFYRRKNY